MKETGIAHWVSPNTGATNESGFAALPAGTRSIYSKFFYIGYHAYFWSSVEFSDTDAWFFYLKYIEKDGRKYYFIALLLFLISLLSKGMAASFPVVLRRTGRRRERRFGPSPLEVGGRPQASCGPTAQP